MKYRCRLLPSYYFQCAGDRSNGGENLVHWSAGGGWSPSSLLSQSPQLCPGPASLLPSSQTDPDWLPGGQINFWEEIVRSWGKIGSCEIVKCWTKDWKDNLVQFSHFLFSIFPRPGWSSWSNQVIISAWCVPNTVNSIITLLANLSRKPLLKPR